MLLNRLKEYIKSQNRKGRLLHLYVAGIKVLKLRTSLFDCVGRFINRVLILYYTQLHKFEILETDPSLFNTRFLVFLKHDGEKRQVIKIPRWDSRNGRALIRRLRNPKERRDYRNILLNADAGKPLGDYIARVTNVYGTGGYSMECIEGYNLGTIFKDLLAGKTYIPHATLSDIVNAIDEFLFDVKFYLSSTPPLGIIHHL